MANYWEKLEIWVKSHELTLEIYRLIPQLPDSEKYALADQIKRSAYSVPANIVEGYSRQSSREFLKFLYQARGSLEELRYFLKLAVDLDYINNGKFYNLKQKTEVISKMLNGLIKKIKMKI
jgi:four helix bundle protein